MATQSNDPFAEFVDAPALPGADTDPFAEFVNANALQQPAEPAKRVPQLPAKGEHPAKKYNLGIERARSALRGMTMGVSDVAGAGIAAGAAALGGADFGDAYKDIKTDISGQRDAYREDKPVEAIATEMGGAIAPAILTLGAGGTPAVAGLGKTMAKGSAIGAAQGGLYGATQADVGSELAGAKEGATVGGILGGVLPAVGRAVGRVINPNASQNAQLQALKEIGVEPTIGQALGGIANKMEQKAQSIPLVGEKIAQQRGAAREQFNTGVINEVLKPIGAKITGAGQDAVKEAGDIISKKYDSALSKINGVKFDNEFSGKLSELRGMAQNLTEESTKRFEKIIENNIGRRMSEAGAMIPETYKKVDSELGKIASNATDKELGDAVKQLRQLMREQMMRSNPDVAGELKAADTAYAMLTRVEDAAVKAVNNDGIFSPAQLNAAIKAAEKSTRKRAVARGDALMQDIGAAGQKTLSETVPNSGTVDRAAQIATGAMLAMNPVAAATGLGIGYGAYTKPVQNALVRMATQRGESAPLIAQDVNALLQSPAARLGVIANQSGGK